MYELLFTKQAQKDAKRLGESNLTASAKQLLEIIRNDPFQNPPPYKKLKGNLSGAYSRRINIQHRLVYSVDEANKEIRILRMWTHYSE